MKKIEKGLFWLLILFCLIRLPFVFIPVMRSAIVWNEGITGAIALEMMHGLSLPLWDYAVVSYALGYFVVATWIAPFFYLFGSNLFSLRLSCFAWYFLTLIAWYFVFRKQFSHKQTFFILLIFLLLPPQTTECMTIHLGLHYEMITWMALSILVLGRFVEGKTSPTKAALLLGFLGGFSTAMSLSNLTTVAILWIYVALLRNRGVRKSPFYLFYVSSFLIGVLPLLAYNWHVGWEGVDYFVALFQPDNSPLELYHNFVWMLRHSLRVLLDYPWFGTLSRYFFRDGFVLIYLFSLLYLLWKRRRFWDLKRGLDLEVFALLFQVLLIILFVLVGHWRSPIYLFPMIPFISMTLVATGIYLQKKSFNAALIFICILGGFLGQIHLIVHRYPGSTLSMEGYSYSEIVGSLHEKYSDVAVVHKKLRQLSKGKPAIAKEQIYRHVSFDAPDDKTLSFIKETELEFQPILYEQLGMSLGKRFAVGGVEEISSFLERHKIPATFHPILYRGVSQALGTREELLWQYVVEAVSFCAKVPEEAKPLCYEGLGRMERTLEGEEKFDLPNEILALIEPSFLPDYVRGVGEFVAHRLSALDVKLIQHFLDSVDEKEREEFLNGFSQGIAKEEDPNIRLMLQSKLNGFY